MEFPVMLDAKEVGLWLCLDVGLEDHYKSINWR